MPPRGDPINLPEKEAPVLPGRRAEVQVEARQELSDMPQAELPSKSGIYQIVCRSTKKAYIGKSVNIAKRWRQHKDTLNRGTHRSPRLQFAWLKYGRDDFYCEVLELVEGQEALLAREQWHLDARKARTGDKEYNICEYAYGPLGVKRTEEARARMRQAHVGRQMSERQLKSLRGRKMPPLTEYQRQALLDAHHRMKGQPITPAQRAAYDRRKERPPTERQLAYWAAKKTAPLTDRQKASYAARRGKAPSEKAQASNAARRGTTLSAETRARMSASHQARLARLRALEALDPSILAQPPLFPSETDGAAS